MLKSLQLVSFRNHVDLAVNLGQLTLIVGENARGKTNMMEAMYLLARGESFRAKKSEEMVNWQAEVAHVIGEAEEAEKQSRLQVTVTRGMVQGKRVQKRLYKVNGLGKRKQDFVGLMPAVLFRPEDLEVIGGEPAKRRGFLDEVLVQINREYRWSLASYQKGLKQRNRLLDQIREGRVGAAALYFWNQLLMKEGEIIQRKREELVNNFNELGLGGKHFSLRYLPSVLSPEKLEKHFEAEVALGYTLSGPHKDEVLVFEGERDLAVYGSRGEQRMAVLWLKQAQMKVMELVGKERPILLLDDVLSELDHHHVEEVVGLCRQQQTVVTTTDEAISDYLGSGVSILRLREENDN